MSDVTCNLRSNSWRQNDAKPKAQREAVAKAYAAQVPMGSVQGSFSLSTKCFSICDLLDLVVGPGREKNGAEETDRRSRSCQAASGHSVWQSATPWPQIA